ncbi:MAG: aminoacyl-tRNA hydrolase [Chloroflexota bacterium]|nr:aminoacyl-tRNA hydrolase [Chloroflexota bacterium]
MKLVVGLGNPGPEYAKTRHNLGFMVVDELARRAAADGAKRRFRADVVTTTLAGESVTLVKPQTFMNLSGHAVREARSWFKVGPEDLLIVYDDIDLPFGSLRLRTGGTAGGHNGLTSIIEQLGTPAIPRLRMGIGRGAGVVRSRVLSRFSATEEGHLAAFVGTAADAVTTWAGQGILAAMNAHNGTALPPETVPVAKERQGFTP